MSVFDLCVFSFFACMNSLWCCVFGFDSSVGSCCVSGSLSQSRAMSLYMELLAQPVFEIVSDTELEVSSDEELISGSQTSALGASLEDKAFITVPRVAAEVVDSSASSVVTEASGGSTLPVVTESSSVIMETASSPVVAVASSDDTLFLPGIEDRPIFTPSGSSSSVPRAINRPRGGRRTKWGRCWSCWSSLRVCVNQHGVPFLGCSKYKSSIESSCTFTMSVPLELEAQLPSRVVKRRRVRF